MTEPLKNQIVFGFVTPEEAKRMAMRSKLNPCIPVYGPGPAERQCESCVHIRAHRHSRTYYKCDLRKLTHGPGSDHKLRWPACGRYEEAHRL